MNREIVQVKYMTANKTAFTTQLIICDESPYDPEEVLLETIINNKKYVINNKNYFLALRALRMLLEKEGIQLICNGAAENVYPSRMQLDMGTGRKAYRIIFGQQAKLSDVVDIFELDDTLHFVSVCEQDEFYDNWISSIGHFINGRSGIE